MLVSHLQQPSRESIDFDDDEPRDGFMRRGSKRGSRRSRRSRSSTERLPVSFRDRNDRRNCWRLSQPIIFDSDRTTTGESGRHRPHFRSGFHAATDVWDECVLQILSHPHTFMSLFVAVLQVQPEATRRHHE